MKICLISGKTFLLITYSHIIELVSTCKKQYFGINTQFWLRLACATHGDFALLHDLQNVWQKQIYGIFCKIFNPKHRFRPLSFITMYMNTVTIFLLNNCRQTFFFIKKLIWAFFLLHFQELYTIKVNLSNKKIYIYTSN